MQQGTHTRISLIRDHVNDYRKSMGWSREAFALEVVKAHAQIGNDIASGIVFDPPTKEPFERARVIADRVFRWLNDVDKDNNLLPIEAEKSVVAALPVEIRVRLINAIYGDLGVSTRAVADAPAVLDPVGMFRKVLKEANEVTAALANLVDGVDPGELEEVRDRGLETISALDGVVNTVSAVIARGGK